MSPGAATLKSWQARVFVTLKPVVNDPQGVTVQGALHTLGFPEVERVRVGKYLELRLAAESVEAASERVRGMCQKLLANPVIEDFRFELAETEA
jgi:phosphoribosylformylglycinamidine synthase PurS subunit